MISDEEKAEMAAEWRHPLEDDGDALLCDVLKGMESFKLDHSDVPLIIRLTENPNYRVARFLGGAVDLFTHDCIHVLLGRGLLAKDEAFVIGYTMGSSKKMKRWRRNLFMFISKHLYPEGYNFNEEERFVFYSGVVSGEKCPTDFARVDFKKFLNYKIQDIRDELGVDKDLLECYYCFEKKCFPKSVESQRLTS